MKKQHTWDKPDKPEEMCKNGGYPLCKDDIPCADCPKIKNMITLKDAAQWIQTGPKKE